MLKGLVLFLFIKGLALFYRSLRVVVYYAGLFNIEKGEGCSEVQPVDL